MSRYEAIQFTPMREVINGSLVTWEPDPLAESYADLPQIFFESGAPWVAANDWALFKRSHPHGGKHGTIASLMKHLCAYSTWLERKQLDWKHFPVKKSDRPLLQFRGHLIRQRERGEIAPSTATSRMNAVIQFYRFAQVCGYIDSRTQMWDDRTVVRHFYDATGFARTMRMKSSELAIPNRQRIGLTLEDGLLPLRPQHAAQLLTFTKAQGLVELHLMVSLGIMTGARLETIMTLGVRNIESAIPDPNTQDCSLIRVGPGAGVKTKGDVSGHLIVPVALVEALKEYAYDMRRLARQAKATAEDKGLLFLTTRGNAYKHGTFNKLMSELRHRALAHGMKFMRTFKFHQTRATFGTIAMTVALEHTTVAGAIDFVKTAMLHKDAAVTLRYVKFLQQTPVKIAVSNEFTALFSGVTTRRWNV